jgi:hypothetical protein
VECDNIVSSQLYLQSSPASVHLIPGILEKGVKVMMFAGDEDLICNYKGIERLIDELVWKARDDGESVSSLIFMGTHPISSTGCNGRKVVLERNICWNMANVQKPYLCSSKSHDGYEGYRANPSSSGGWRFSYGTKLYSASNEPNTIICSRSGTICQKSRTT